ncbi:hypothetical protein RN001_011184 [Aquatica leii]|uniref:Peptidase S1 domain-containing protein n=1 Tax=Aquatica leii TaxID=1421715 RepID=A0AAN7P8U5_9COLE|nr:hypothetical protein RN001_011184 [Aquatica leii]
MKLLHCLVLVLVLVGASARRYQGRIVGGSQATDSQFPYQVSLRNTALTHICGGSIISDYRVLTSAFCIYGKGPSDLFVAAGSNYLSNGTILAVSRLLWYTSYNPNTLENNLAVIRTANRILDVPKTGTVYLNIAGTLPGQVCSLSGWGKRSSSASSYPNELYYTTLKVISLNDCRSFYPEYNLDNNVVCTEGGSAGGCDGDNGSPLVSSGIQIGILSWGIPCATGKPDVFVNVAPYNNWITSTLV